MMAPGHLFCGDLPCSRGKAVGGGAGARAFVGGSCAPRSQQLGHPSLGTHSLWSDKPARRSAVAAVQGGKTGDMPARPVSAVTAVATNWHATGTVAGSRGCGSKSGGQGPAGGLSLSTPGGNAMVQLVQDAGGIISAAQVSHAGAAPMTTNLSPGWEMDAQERFALERKRLEEERAQQREERSKTAKWWEVKGPANMVLANSMKALRTLVEAGLEANKLVVINYFSPECYGCRSLAPKLKQIAENNPDVIFVKANGGSPDIRESCDARGITKIPFFHLYKDGRQVSAFTCNMRPEKLSLLRAEIAAHSGSSVQTADSTAYKELEN